MSLIADTCQLVSLIAVGVRHNTVHPILYIVSQPQKYSFATRSYLVLL